MLHINRKIAPPIKDAVDFALHLQPYQSFILDNGIKVYAVAGGDQDVLQIEFVFAAGNCFEEKNMVAATTNFLLKNGTKNKNAFAINEHFERYGAYFSRACYNETAVLSLYTLTKHLPKLLPLIQEIFTDSIFPEQELHTYQKNRKQQLAVNLKKCDFVANRIIDTQLYGAQHPYGKIASAKDYDDITQNDLCTFYKKYYEHGSCAIFIAGKLPTEIQAVLNQYFGTLPWRALEKNIAKHIITPAATKHQHIDNDADGVQAAIRIARNFPNRHHPDFQKVQVLNTVFGGFFGSRLMKNIREEKGYTYGIHSFLHSHVSESAWVISTEAGKDFCDATIAEVYKEMEVLRKKKIDKEELQLLRNYMIGTLLGTIDGAFQIIERWKTYLLNDLDESYFYNAINTITTIKADELQHLAEKYLHPEAFYQLTVV